MIRTLLTVLVLSLLSTPVFAEWTKVSENENGYTYYVDFERIKKHGGYVYWWELGDYLKPSKQGILSDKTYNQGDCKLFRWKRLDASYHTQPMGQGTPYATGVSPGQVWHYPSPNSSGEIVLKSVCKYVK